MNEKFNLDNFGIIDLGAIDFDKIAISKTPNFSGRKLPNRYIINKNATILFWEDGSKTVVKRCEDDKYDKRLGFLIGYFQKCSGLSKTKANKFLRDLVEERDD